MSIMEVKKSFSSLQKNIVEHKEVFMFDTFVTDDDLELHPTS